MPDFIAKIDPTGKGLIGIDWFFARLGENTTLKDDEKLVVTFAQIDPKKQDITEINITRLAGVLFQSASITKPALNGNKNALAAALEALKSRIGDSTEIV